MTTKRHAMDQIPLYPKTTAKHREELKSIRKQLIK